MSDERGETFLGFIRENVTYDPRSIHYSRRKHDGFYEIIGRTLVDGEWREVALEVQPNRVKALEAVRFLRGHANNRNKEKRNAA